MVQSAFGSTFFDFARAPLLPHSDNVGPRHAAHQCPYSSRFDKASPGHYLQRFAAWVGDIVLGTPRSLSPLLCRDRQQCGTERSPHARNSQEIPVRSVRAKCSSRSQCARDPSTSVQEPLLTHSEAMPASAPPFY